MELSSTGINVVRQCHYGQGPAACEPDGSQSAIGRHKADFILVSVAVVLRKVDRIKARLQSFQIYGPSVPMNVLSRYEGSFRVESPAFFGLCSTINLETARGCVKGGGKADHWGGGIVDHRRGGSWLGDEGVRRRLGRPELGAQPSRGCA